MHFTSLCVLALLLVCARATPIPWDTSAATGQGGNASGGSVNDSPSVVNILSNNGGAGGDASSGPALASHSSKNHSPGDSNTLEGGLGFVNILGLGGDQRPDSENTIV
ncbi:hypothetical protein B0H13DRAFT_1956225 [Mycena leptocephala]|nr:hypothetical protein B0H13DRAFT_1956225 [Mycena leptocephala]